jgi:hypothetical protein
MDVDALSDSDSSRTSKASSISFSSSHWSPSSPPPPSSNGADAVSHTGSACILQVARRAVASTPEDHSDLAACLNNLGNRLGSRYERTGDKADIEEANRVFGRSWASYTSVPFTRIYAASQCLKMLFYLEQYDEAAEIAVSVIDLLPIVSARSLDRNDRQHVVSRFAGITADACGVLLQARNPETALQYLEKGRAIILGQMIDNWSDLSSLAKAHPKVATKFKALRDNCQRS